MRFRQAAAAMVVVGAGCSSPAQPAVDGGGGGDARPAGDAGPDAAPDAPRAVTPLFRMDYSASAAPAAGWDGIRADNAGHTMTRVAAGGPSGQDAYRLVLDHEGPDGGDDYWGHGSMFPAGAPFVYGGRAYLRWRFRWLPGTDCRSYEQAGTGLLAGIARNKIVIANDGSSSVTSRFILQTECEHTPLRYYWRLQKGGGVDPADTPTQTTFGVWVDVQVELQYSSAEGVADGAYRIWLDENDRSAPAAEAAGIVLNADVTPGFIQFGAYFNNGVYSDGAIGWEHADFEIDDEFDTAWH